MKFDNNFVNNKFSKTFRTFFFPVFRVELQMQSACFNLKLKDQICYVMYGLGKSMGFLILKSRVHRIQEKNVNMPHP